MITVKLKLKEGVELPKYQTPGSGAVDLVFHDVVKLYTRNNYEMTNVDETFKGFKSGGVNYICIRPGERALIDTGLTLADIEEGYKLDLTIRSGQALKNGLSLSNSKGLVDNDYRDMIGLILTNTTNALVRINKGDRIAQMEVVKYNQTKFEAVEEVKVTERKGGFGSTGV